ncbi:MAG: Arc family DNA-binding protein [Acidobacteria bacterium]|nr:Arc family DNA-binding protein [Acidobacteriota bacterium]
MDGRKSFLLRIDAKLLDELRRLAGDEFRSLNGQIEYLLREALRQRGRLKASRPEEGR